jgi:hypothetical protein
MATLGTLFTFGGLAASMYSAQQQRKAGALTQERYNQQAENERLKYRFEANRSRQQTAEILKRTNETMAAANAGAYRRGVDPSAFGLAINTQILSPAIADLISSDINTQLAELSGEAQYADLIKAGEIAKEGGITAGAMTMASGLMNATSIG